MVPTYLWIGIQSAGHLEVTTAMVQVGPGITHNGDRPQHCAQCAGLSGKQNELLGNGGLYQYFKGNPGKQGSMCQVQVPVSSSSEGNIWICGDESKAKMETTGRLVPEM